MQVFLVIVRAVVCVVALLGAGGSFFVGLAWRNQAIENWELIELGRMLRAEVRSGAVAGLNADEVPEVEEKARQLEGMLKAIPFLLAGGLLALVGGVLAVIGRTGCAAVWLFAAGIGPAILQPMVLCFTFTLFLAALLSLLASLLTFAASKAAPAVAL
jgi:hypothetical protein